MLDQHNLDIFSALSDSLLSSGRTWCDLPGTGERILAVLFLGWTGKLGGHNLTFLHNLLKGPHIQDCVNYLFVWQPEEPKSKRNTDWILFVALFTFSSRQSIEFFNSFRKW